MAASVRLGLIGRRHHVHIVGKLGQVFSAQHGHAAVLLTPQGRHDLVSLALPATHVDSSNSGEISASIRTLTPAIRRG